MGISNVNQSDLRVHIAPAALGFGNTSELLDQPLPWVGQERAQTAARFGLGLMQRDYNLFVLGEVGSGRSSLLQQEMHAIAAKRPAPPDLCYLHNFKAPEKPLAMRLLSGQGRHFRQRMAQLCKTLQKEIPLILSAPDFKAESERIKNAYKKEETKAYDELDRFAESRHFALYREEEHLVFTLLGEKGNALTENEARSLPKGRRAQIDVAEQELREAIAQFLEKIRPMERAMNEGLAALQREVVKPLLEQELLGIGACLKAQTPSPPKLDAYLDSVMHDVLDNVALFVVSDEDDEARQTQLNDALDRYRVNVLVDNDGLHGAPVIVENNPGIRTLFGNIDYQPENDVLITDFSRIRAGSLLVAHGGFLMLHLRDLLVDELVWEKLRRFLRDGRLQIEEFVSVISPIAAVSLEPEAVEVDVKIVLIGAVEQYYELQELDPEFARHFRIKVDFVESFTANAQTYAATAVFVAHACQRLGLPHFSAAAVGRLLEESHREVGDQTRQSAIFGGMESLMTESAALCTNQSPALVDVSQVEAALAARCLRHDYPEQRLRESIADGDRLITVQGARVGQINGLSQIDLGDYRFGFPVRVTARTFAGDEGLLNIEREVEMSGPIHDKGVLILHSYLSALFSHIAPLALNASVVFEQEYSGVEGDSASCAELYVLLSSLSGVPLLQGIAVTGAVNLHGEVLPVGGINEKIEGYYRVCEAAGLDGSQGVLIPQRNRRHLMLNHPLQDAVGKGLFHIYTANHVGEGMALLTGSAMGLPVADLGRGGYPADTVLGRAQRVLQNYRRACQSAQQPHQPGKVRRYSRD